MRALQAVLMTTIVAGLGLGAASSEAKRIGAATAKASSSAARTADDGLKKPGVSISPTFRASATGSAAGVVAGTAAAKALTNENPALQPESDRAAVAEDKRLAKLSDFERKAEIEEMAKKAEQAAQAAEMRRKADLAAQAADETRRQEAAEAKRRAAEEQLAESKRQAIEREKSCVIKSAMTDAEIDHCKWVWSFPPPS